MADSKSTTGKHLGGVVISYAHNDNISENPNECWLNRLREHLAPLEGEWSHWSDKELEVGDKWHETIQAHFQAAPAAILLVSPAFLASKYIRDKEMPILLQANDERGLLVLCVVLRPCYLEGKFKYPHPRRGPRERSLDQFQTAGSCQKTLSDMKIADQDREFLKIAKQVVNLMRPDPLLRQTQAASFTTSPSVMDHREILDVPPAYFQNQTESIEAITNFVHSDEQRLFILKGDRGSGRTAVVCKALRELDADRTRTDPRAIVSLSTRSKKHHVSFQCIYDELCALLVSRREREHHLKLRESDWSQQFLMESLLGRFQFDPVVLFLDGFEELIDASRESGLDEDMEAVLKALLVANYHRVKVIVTAPVDFHFSLPDVSRSAWRSKKLPKLSVMIEFDLAYRSGDYERAARRLMAVDRDWLAKRGHYSQIRDGHEKLRSKLRDPLLKQRSLGKLGSAHYKLQDFTLARKYHSAALQACRRMIGQRHKHAAEARVDAAKWLNNLGNCDSIEGHPERAVKRYYEALKIVSRRRQKKKIEPTVRNNLADCYGEIGEVEEAMSHLRRAESLCEKYENWRSMGYVRLTQSLLYIDQQNYDAAVMRADDGREIGIREGSIDIRIGSYFYGALANYYAGKLGRADQLSETGLKEPHPEYTVGLYLLKGLIASRRQKAELGIPALTNALTLSHPTVTSTHSAVNTFDYSGLAHSGLVLYGEKKHADEAIASFRKARKLCRAKGVVQRVVRLLDSLTVNNHEEMLQPIRDAALGK